MGQRPTCQEVGERVNELEREALLAMQAKEALQESEEPYRMIFNHSPLGIIHFDQRGVIVDCNEHFLKIMGASRETAIGFHMGESLEDEAMRPRFWPHYLEGQATLRVITGLLSAASSPRCERCSTG